MKVVLLKKTQYKGVHYFSNIDVLKSREFGQNGEGIEYEANVRTYSININI